VLGLLDSVSDVDYSGKILFLEGVSDYVFAVDLALYTLKRSGKSKNLSGLVVERFAKLGEDEDIPFKKSVEVMGMNVVKEYEYPVCFEFSMRGIEDKQAVVIGRRMHLEVGKEKTVAYYV
jgi:muramoyltetrapeptide carboxypeptidase